MIEKSDLKAQLFQKDQEISNLRLQREQLTAKLTQVDQSITNSKKLQEALHQKEEEVEELKRVCKERETKERHLSVELNQIKDSFHRMEEHLREELDQQVKELETNISDLQKTVRMKDNTIEQQAELLQATINEKEQLKREFEGRNSFVSQSINEAKSREDKLQHQTTSLVSEKERLQKGVFEKDQQIAVLGKELEQQSASLHSLRQQLQQKTEQLKESKEQLTKTKGERDALQSTYSQLLAQCQQLHQRLNEADSRNGQLEKQIESLQQKTKSTPSTLPSSFNDFPAAEDSADQRIDLLKKFQQKVDQLTKEKEDLVTKISQYNGVVDQFKQSNNSLVDQISSLQSKFNSERQLFTTKISDLESNLIPDLRAQISQLSSDLNRSVARANDSTLLLEQLKSESKRLQEQRMQQEQVQWTLVQPLLSISPSAESSDAIQSSSLEFLQEKKIMELLEEIESLNKMFHDRHSFVNQLRASYMQLESKVIDLSTRLQETSEMKDLLISQMVLQIDSFDQIDGHLAEKGAAIDQNLVSSLKLFKDVIDTSRSILETLGLWSSVSSSELSQSHETTSMIGGGRGISGRIEKDLEEDLEEEEEMEEEESVDQQRKKGWLSYVPIIRRFY